MLTINALHFNYFKRPPVLSGISLDLGAGHIYGLLGKNGAGKSTLLKNMVGLAAPSSGSCIFHGEKVFNRSVTVLEDLFFLPEEIAVPALTPARYLANTACFYPGFNENEFYKHLDTLEVDRHGIMSKQSHGEQKKTMIAFGLAAGTSLLVLDEPTNGLDIPSKLQFRKLIASVQTEDRCIVISTHQVRDLDGLIDTLLVLDNGQMILDKSMDEISNHCYFGVFDDTTGLPVLYQEQHIRGQYAILKNTQGKMSKPDLELLFNGITGGSDTLLEVLNN